MITRDFFEKNKSKICISVMGKNLSELSDKLDTVISYNPDIIEFRADYFEDIFDKEKLKEAIYTIKTKRDLPLIFTIRTANEGGELSISSKEYKDLLLYVASIPAVDVIDIEYMMGYEVYEEVINVAHKNNILVIGSYHDFEKTEEEEFIYNMLKNMYDSNMDISKIALMPKCKADVMKLLNTTLKINNDIKDIVTVTMSMGSIGSISRIIGGYFGSVMTFGAASEASAPGQINAIELRSLKDKIC